MSKEQKPLEVTPPSAFKDSLITPPPTEADPRRESSTAVKQAVDFFKDRVANLPNESDLFQIQLADRDFEEIHNELAEDPELYSYVNDKIKYHYSADINLLVIQTGEINHEDPLAGIIGHLNGQLVDIRHGEEGAARNFANEINWAASRRISFLDGSKHIPDSTWTHQSSKFPTMILEIAHSVSLKVTCRRAEDYIYKSNGAIRTVIVFKVGYNLPNSSESKKDRSASITLFRSKIEERTDGKELVAAKDLDEVMIRDRSGKRTDFEGLRLTLSDFAVPGETNELRNGGDVDLFLSGDILCQYLVKAEKEIRREKELPMPSLPLGVYKRRRSSTPALPEEGVQEKKRTNKMDPAC